MGKAQGKQCLTNALHWTTAILRFWRNPRGHGLAVARERRALGVIPEASRNDSFPLSL